MSFDDFSGDIQSGSKAAVVATRNTSLEKPENPRMISRSDSQTMIDDLKSHMFIDHRTFDHDG
jgi:hypothetical protein